MIYLISFISFLFSLLGLILKILAFNNVYIKCLLLPFMLTLAFYIYTQPIRNRLVLSKLRAWKNRFPYGFMLRTDSDKLINAIIIVIYILIFIFGFLGLRFLNRNRIIDLKIYYTKFYTLLHNMSIFEIYLNLLLIISIIVLYMLILYKITKYFKSHMLRRLIYWSNPRLGTFSDRYVMNIIQRFKRYIHPRNVHIYIKFNLHSIGHKLWLKTNPSIYRLYGTYTFPLNKKDSISYFFMTPLEHTVDMLTGKILSKLQNGIHKYILILVIIYDIVYNNAILSYMYAVLPYVFIYELIVRISKFLDNTNDFHNMLLYELLYESSERITDNEFLIAGHQYVTTEELEELVTYYVLTDLQDIHGKWNPIQVKEPPRFNIIETYYKIQDYLDNYNTRISRILFLIWLIYLLEILQSFIMSFNISNMLW